MSNKQREKFFDVIYFIDLFGLNFNLLYKNHIKFKSIFTVISSLLFITIFIIILIIFGIKEINHNTYKITTSTSSDYYAEINLSDTPLMFQYLDSNNKYLPESDNLFNFKVLYMNYTMGKNGLETNIRLIQTEVCNKSKHFLEYSEYFSEYPDVNFTEFKCLVPGQDIIISGKRNDFVHGNKQLYIFLTKCNNNISDCNSNMDNILNGGFFNFYHLGVSPQHDNYSHPLIFDIRVDSCSFSTDLFKKQIFQLAKSYYISDNGILFENNKIYDFFQFDGIVSDVSIERNGFANFPTAYGFVNVQSASLIYSYKRTYIKLPEIIANISALMNLTFFILRTISEYFTVQIYQQDLINNFLKLERKYDFNLGIKDLKHVFANKNNDKNNNNVNNNQNYNNNEIIKNNLLNSKNIYNNHPSSQNEINEITNFKVNNNIGNINSKQNLINIDENISNNYFKENSLSSKNNSNKNMIINIDNKKNLIKNMLNDYSYNNNELGLKIKNKINKDNRILIENDDNIITQKKRHSELKIKHFHSNKNNNKFNFNFKLINIDKSRKPGGSFIMNNVLNMNNNSNVIRINNENVARPYRQIKLSCFNYLLPFAYKNDKKHSFMRKMLKLINFYLSIENIVPILAQKKD